ncbi:hypothetical protein [Bradyrhizobium yuanmingense]|uniref:hypothetical protein n=1 Tax=Bradyrhizobium yuanmingense TaxID=108015 RepID=UPI003519159D
MTMKKSPSLTQSFSDADYSRARKRIEARDNANRLDRENRRRVKSSMPADPTVLRLMKTISACRAREREAWAMLSNYLATGRTIIRERLPGPIATTR